MRAHRCWLLRWKIHFLVIFGSVLCYFSPKKWLTKAIFAFYSTLVNTCWPHVYPPKKLILESSKRLLELHFLSISWSQTSYSFRGVEKTLKLSLELEVGITTFISQKLPSDDSTVKISKDFEKMSPNFWVWDLLRSYKKLTALLDLVKSPPHTVCRSDTNCLL